MPTPSWPVLHDMASERSPEIDRAFHWGLDVLERWLGEGWPEACYRSGGLPPELGSSSWSLHALAMLIDLAGALKLLDRGKGMGKVRRALKSSPNWETIASTRCTLRLAIAGLRAGLRPEPEHVDPPMDLILMLDGDGVGLGLEIKTLRRSDLTIEHRDPSRTDCRPAGLVRAGLEASPVWAGTNRFEVRRPQPDERPGSQIAMPAQDLWRRVTARIAFATEQMTRSGASWLVIETLDNMWELTPWSREPAAVRASSLAQAAREFLATETHVAGVVFTDGAAMTNAGSPDEDARPNPGVMFMRRRLDYVRSRQTIVVARMAAFRRCRSGGRCSIPSPRSPSGRYLGWGWLALPS